MTNNDSDPVKELRKLARKVKNKGKGKGPRGKGVPFKRGFDPRRNVHGAKPRTGLLLREMILDVLAEQNEIPDPLTGERVKQTQAYTMVRRMILGKNQGDHSEIFNRAFGKVPDETRNLSEIDEFILNNMDLFTDGQIERIKKGENKAMILSEVLRDALKQIKKKTK